MKDWLLDIIQMRVIYGIIYYYFIGMVLASVATIIFVVKPIRRAVFNFMRNKDFFRNRIFNTAFIAIMILCIVIFVDSVNNTFQYAKNIGECKSILIQSK